MDTRGNWAPIFRKMVISGAMLLHLTAQAQERFLDNVVVVNVAVNGGADTANPGTSCIQVTPLPVAACTGGWISLPNNNRQLLATTLLAKSTAARVMVYYLDSAAGQHCPGITHTPCSVISLVLK